MYPGDTTRSRYEKHDRKCEEMQELDSVHHTDVTTCRSRTPTWRQGGEREMVVQSREQLFSDEPLSHEYDVIHHQ